MKRSRNPCSKHQAFVAIFSALTFAAPSFAVTGETDIPLRSYFEADGSLCTAGAQYSMASLSGDGRYLTFSANTDFLLSPGGHSIAAHAYVLDRETNQLERISKRTDNGLPGDGKSWGSSISGDGRYVAFLSRATNLVDGDTNGVEDIFLHDRQDGSIIRLTQDPPPGNTDTRPYRALQISTDGRHVVFSTLLDGLDPGDSNGSWDVYAYDIVADNLELVSVDALGAAAGATNSGHAISENGQIISFVSDGSNLVAGVGNGFEQVYVRDLSSSQTELISIDLNGDPAADSAWVSSMNADGTLVVFAAVGQDLSTIDDHGKSQIYLRDRTMDSTEIVSLVDGSTSLAGNNDSDLAPGEFGSFHLISDDGRFVVFTSRSPNDLTNETPANWAGFVRDRVNGTTRLVSQSTDGSISARVLTQSISSDGRYVSFTTASYLYQEDFLPYCDIDRDSSTEWLYVHDLGPTEPVEMVEELVEIIFDLNLSNGITNSLDAKVNSALDALEDMNENNDQAACNSLDALINAIEAQSGNHIETDDATDLIERVEAVQDAIPCG